MDELLRGYQSRERWMGTEVLTLDDVWPEGNCRTAIVGLNPAPSSVAAGHYYQGQSGQRQLHRLVDAGLFSRPTARFFEESALQSGVGFTDIVKRPTAGERQISKAEIEFGTELLSTKLSSRDVSLVVCVFRHPVGVLLGSFGVPGLQTRRTSWGAQVFRMPGPFAPAAEVAEVMGQLQNLLGNR